MSIIKKVAKKMLRGGGMQNSKKILFGREKPIRRYWEPWNYPTSTKSSFGEGMQNSKKIL